MRPPFDLFLAQMGIAALIAVGLVLLVMAPAFAYTCDPVANTCTPTIRITEPSTYTSGAPLTDYQETDFVYTINAGPQATLAIPASSVAGGQVVTNSNLLVAVGVCQKATITGAATGVTKAGNRSAPSPTVTLVMDRTKLAPAFTQPDPTCVTPSSPGSLSIQ